MPDGYSRLAGADYSLYLECRISLTIKFNIPMKKIFFSLWCLFFSGPRSLPSAEQHPVRPGAITTLPPSHNIAAGTTYCISGPINDATDYTINGTLTILSGSVTLGNLTVGKTGSLIINFGSRLKANSYTGEATAPASVISNVTVCTYGVPVFVGRH